MAVDGGHRGIETGVGNAPLTDATVVVLHMLEQPVDAVVGVAGLVDLAAALDRVVRAHVDELALAHVLAAHILVDEDVAGLLVGLAGAQ